MKKILFLFLILLLVSCNQSGEKDNTEKIDDLTAYVDPFIGTGEHLPWCNKTIWNGASKPH